LALSRLRGRWARFEEAFVPTGSGNDVPSACSMVRSARSPRWGEKEDLLVESRSVPWRRISRRVLFWPARHCRDWPRVADQFRCPSRSGRCS
jgi:hypothetical protein